MEKKMLIACLATAVSSVGVLGGVTAKTISDVNDATEVVAEPLVTPAATDDMRYPGNAAYAAIKNTGNWQSDGACFYIYFFQSDTVNAWSTKLTAIEDCNYKGTDTSYTMYETTVPYLDGVSYWNKAIVVRADPTSTSGSWSVKWNQSADIVLQSSKNLLVMTTSDTWWDTLAATHDVLAAEDRLNVWGDHTEWGKDSGICKADGSTDRSALQAAWTESASTFEKLGYDVKACFSNLNTTVGTHDECNDLANRYDYILQKYTFEDFASRG